MKQQHICVNAPSVATRGSDDDDDDNIDENDDDDYDDYSDDDKYLTLTCTADKCLDSLYSAYSSLRRNSGSLFFFINSSPLTLSSMVT